MPGSCAVLGCRNRFVRGGKHFYRFPKNEQYKQIWSHFSRRGNGFVVKTCSAICEDHFADERVVVKKKGRLYLVKETVPTIYYRETKMGTERVVVEYDPITSQYVGRESINLIRETVSVEDQKALMQERYHKLRVLKNLCRFCFESQDDKFVAISKLEAYSINTDEMLILLGIGTQYSEVFSEIVCEQCFQQIVSIDGYRKRCVKSQEDIVNEMEDIDQKLLNCRTLDTNERPWFMFKEDAEEDQLPSHIEIIEEHLEDNILFDEEDEDEKFHDQFEAADFEFDEVHDDQKDIRRMIVIDETTKEEHMDDILIQSFDSNYEEMEAENEEEDSKDFHGYPEPVDKDIYYITEGDAIIKNPERNSFALRVYECFFCRLKFAGKKTFKAHECQVKEVKCEVEGCDKFFNKLSGYNTHVVKVHGLLKTSKHFCPICKNVVMSTENQFKMHCRQCNKESEKKDSDNPIECEVCQKRCPNLKSYTVHKLFHDARNLVTGERHSAGYSLKGPSICELCGKEFTNAQGLRTHKKNVHLVGQPKDIVYQCDICSKMRPTKRSLFNHMRNVHRVREATCNVCGKVFRTPALLQKHMMYHDETKRIHRCPICPDKPGWFTNVALKRHQKSHQ